MPRDKSGRIAMSALTKCDTLINAGIIVSQNPEREVLENASIAIDAGKILALGPTEYMRTQWRAGKTLDFPHSLLMPGLINAHTHAAMTFLRGYADDLPLLEWLQNKIFPVEARLSPEIVRLGSLLGYAEMLACGVTACVDMYLFEDAVLEAAEQAGLRCMGGEAVFSFPSPACATYQDALERTAFLAEKYRNSERIKIAVNPHSVYTTGEQILAACRDLAIKYKLPLHIHLAESQAETANCQAMHSMRPVAWCEKNQILDCRVLAAHLVDLTPDEIDLLTRKQVMAIHNPGSNMKLASGISPVPAMLEAGMIVGLGTDGPASNNTLNIFQEMNRAALLHKVNQSDPALLPAGKVLDMATIHGGAIFGEAGLGALTPGSPADLVALDMRKPHMSPMHTPISQLVYAASGHECHMTMVAGEILYQDGKFTRFDIDGLMAELNLLRNFVTAS